jgi:hypothetical protein
MIKTIRSSKMSSINRRIIRSTSISLAKNYREEIIKRLKGGPVTLALDGWTNVSGHKVTNMCLLHAGKAYFWRSISNPDAHNTAGK